MAKKTVIRLNHTLDEYQKKYGDKHGQVVNKVDADKDNSLIEGRTWWLIEEKYYEIPQSKCAPARWWKSMGTAGRIVTCVLGAGVIATAVAVPIAIVANQNKGVEHQAIVDPEVQGVTVSQKTVANGALEVTMSYDTSKKELTSVEVYIGNTKLVAGVDYFVNGDVITINKEALEANKTKEIVIKPVLKDKTPVTPTVDALKINTTKIAKQYVKDTLNLDGIEIVAHYTDGSEVKLNKKDVTFNPNEGTVLSTAGELTITATYKNVSKSFTIKIEETLKHTVNLTIMGQLYETQTVEHGSYAVEPEVPDIPGYHISGWFVGEQKFDFKNTPITSDLTIDAHLELNTYTVTVIAGKGGAVSGGGSFKCGEQATVYAVPFEGFAFEGWYENGVKIQDASDIYKFTVEHDCELTANFELQKHEIDVSTPGGGTVEGGGTYEHGSSVTIKAIPAKGYSFVGWYENGVKIEGAEAEYTFTATAPRTIEAIFEVNTYSITYKLNGGTEPAEGNPIEYNVETETFTLNAPTKDKYVFGGWYDNAEFKGQQVKQIEKGSTGDLTLYAKWDDIKVTKVTITNKETKIEVDDKILLTADVEPDEATNKQLTWKVDSDKAVVVYDKTGDAYLTAVKTGTVKVTATAKDGSEVSDTIELEIIPAIVSYNLDWCTTKINEGHGFDGKKTLYDVASSATSIEFIQSESTDGAPCGETEDDKIYANYDASSNKLSIWSKKKIAISDNDRRHDGDYGPFIELAATSINFDNIDTSKMTDMSYMFYYSSSLSALDLSKFNTSNVTNMQTMFGVCQNLENIKFSHLFDTGNVTNMSSMFRETCLTTLDLSGFNTSNVTNMKYMFGDSGKLQTINLSSFNTEAVTDMSYMFFSCSSLSTLDLSSFNTKAVTDMSYMFDLGSGSPSSLETIYVSDKFTTESLKDPTSTMFSYCTKLVGGQGTAFDKDHVDAEYARIDDPLSGNLGYFTDEGQKPHELVFGVYGGAYSLEMSQPKEGTNVFVANIGKEVANYASLFEFFIQDNKYEFIDANEAKVFLNGTDITEQCTCDDTGISFNELKVKEGDTVVIKIYIPKVNSIDVLLSVNYQ